MLSRVCGLTLEKHVLATDANTHAESLKDRSRSLKASAASPSAAPGFATR